MGFTKVADSIAIAIFLIWVSDLGATILVVRNPIPIVVIVAGVSDPVPIRIGLVSVGYGWAIINRIFNAIRVSVSTTEAV